MWSPYTCVPLSMAITVILSLYLRPLSISTPNFMATNSVSKTPVLIVAWCLMLWMPVKKLYWCRLESRYRIMWLVCPLHDFCVQTYVCLQAVQGSQYNGFLAFVFPELRTKRSLYLFLAWSTDVGVHDVCPHHIQQVQGN